MSDRNDEEMPQAVTRFCGGFSCSQAVLSSYAQRYEKLALRLSSGLGGVLGRMGH